MKKERRGMGYEEKGGDCWGVWESVYERKTVSERESGQRILEKYFRLVRIILHWRLINKTGKIGDFKISLYILCSNFIQFISLVFHKTNRDSEQKENHYTALWKLCIPLPHGHSARTPLLMTSASHEVYFAKEGYHILTKGSWHCMVQYIQYTHPLSLNLPRNLFADLFCNRVIKACFHVTLCLVNAKCLIEIMCSTIVKTVIWE